MPANYTAVPGNALLSTRLVVAEPSDGDADSAASFTPPLESLADFAQMAYESYVGRSVTNFISIDSVFGGAAPSGLAYGPWGTSGVPTFVAVVPATTNNIITTQSSPGGGTWATASSPAAHNLNCVASNGVAGASHLFVAGGANYVITSVDGITWTSRTHGFGASGVIEAVCYSTSLGLWVITGSDGSGNGIIQTSPDGTTWTTRTASMTGSVGKFVFWNGTLFVVMSGTSASTSYWTSPNGTTWTTRTLPVANGANIAAGTPWSPMAYANGTYVLATFGGIGGGAVYTSPDAITWTLRTAIANSQQTANWYGVLHNGRCFVLYGQSVVVGGNNIISFSMDGITWKTATQVNYVAGNAGIFSLIQHPISRYLVGTCSTGAIVFTQDTL